MRSQQVINARDIPQFSSVFGTITILFKTITRMKLIFSNYFGDYSYSFQGSAELICSTVAHQKKYKQTGKMFWAINFCKNYRPYTGKNVLDNYLRHSCRNHTEIPWSQK